MSAAVFETAAGWMGIRASAAGLTCVVLPCETRRAAIEEMAETPADVPEDRFTDLIARFRAYFTGEKVAFPDPIDIADATQFRQAVWRAARRVPYGETRSYGWLAAAAGKPGGARAAGQAIGANQLAIIVPCHRVIASDGSLGGFYGGLKLKKFLLDIEAGHQTR